MKKLTTIISVALVVLCFTQCRKEVNTVTPNVGKAYSISLTMDETSKVDVNVVEGEHFGEVTFGAGDKIYVANQGKFVGTLTHDGTKFEGTIYDPGTPISGYLYFYFLGNKAPTEDVGHPATTHPNTLTVEISDQKDGKLPLISCGKSDKEFTGGGSDYSARLGNKCALAKFNITKASDASSKDVLIAGVNNKVVFDLTKISVYTDANVSYSKANGGYINVGKRTGDIWLILLPQDNDEGGVAYTSDLSYYGTRGSLTGVVVNHAIKDAINVIVNTEYPVPSSYPDGTIHGLFTVDNNQKVFFSKGNLQYIGSAGDGTVANKGAYWKFAENQYDHIGVTQATDSRTVDRDLFGWATSGWNNGNYFYQPYCISNITNDTINKSNGFGYGPRRSDGSMGGIDISMDYWNQADWGVYDTIFDETNNVYKVQDWYTPTSNGWRWLIGPNGKTPKENPIPPIPGENCRISSTVNGVANARFTLATINATYKGMIIFPDRYIAGTPTGVSWGTINDYSNYNTTCNADGWAALEAAGCVFLPAAGIRSGEYINPKYVNARGFYWSTSRPEPGYAYQMRFRSDVFNPNYYGTDTERYCGCSIRLVTNYTE